MRFVKYFVIAKCEMPSALMYRAENHAVGAGKIRAEIRATGTEFHHRCDGPRRADYPPPFNKGGKGIALFLKILTDCFESNIIISDSGFAQSPG
jgi:hypothetical protein